MIHQLATFAFAVVFLLVIAFIAWSVAPHIERGHCELINMLTLDYHKPCGS